METVPYIKIRQLTYFGGFNDLVQKERENLNEREAYEKVESLHEEVFGCRRYSGYDSFKTQKSHHKNKLK